MKFSDIRKLKPGDTVFWNDPALTGSRPYVLAYLPDIHSEVGEEVEDTIVALKDQDGSEMECHAAELMAEVPKLAHNQFGFDPVVGMGCTYCNGRDEYACTITAVRKNGRELETRWDRLEPGMMGVKEFTPDPNGNLQVWTLRKNGRFREKSRGYYGSLTLGKRNWYQNPDA